VVHVHGPSLTNELPARQLIEPPAYLGTDLDHDGGAFIPTEELVYALDVEPTAFVRQTGEPGCRPLHTSRVWQSWSGLGGR